MIEKDKEELKRWEFAAEMMRNQNPEMFDKALKGQLEKFVEKDKYYTPQQDEFYVGCEYEWRYEPTGEWIKQDPIDDFWALDTSFDNGDGDHPFMYQYEQVGIRMKYLDKEDMNSLGLTKFNYTYNKEKNLQAGEDENYSHWYKEVGGYKAVINLQTNGSTPFVAIWWEIDTPFINEHNGIRKRSNDLFFGRIKNKSELKRLLKQLDIDNS